ncbi:MAG: aspartyl protease family protein [Methanosarcinales archaeon]
MYVDSGADITLIPRSFGELLGFKVNSSEIQEIRGIGEGTIPVIIRESQLKIAEFVFNVRIAWALIETVPFLLGRLDVLDHFDIIFKRDKVIFVRG